MMPFDMRSLPNSFTLSGYCIIENSGRRKPVSKLSGAGQRERASFFITSHATQVDKAGGLTKLCFTPFLTAGVRKKIGPSSENFAAAQRQKCV
jgi:hypothetical protein